MTIISHLFVLFLGMLMVCAIFVVSFIMIYAWVQAYKFLTGKMKNGTRL